MYNKKYVIPLILVFLVGFFTPYWYNAMAGTIGHVPEMKKPAGNCVEDKDWMAANHMLLLQQWRTQAIRHGAEEEEYTTALQLVKSTMLQQTPAGAAMTARKSSAISATTMWEFTLSAGTATTRRVLKSRITAGLKSWLSISPNFYPFCKAPLFLLQAALPQPPRTPQQIRP